MCAIDICRSIAPPPTAQRRCSDEWYELWGWGSSGLERRWTHQHMNASPQSNVPNLTGIADIFGSQYAPNRRVNRKSTLNTTTHQTNTSLPPPSPLAIYPGRRHRCRHQKAHTRGHSRPQRQVLRHGERGVGFQRPSHGNILRRSSAGLRLRNREWLVEKDTVLARIPRSKQTNYMLSVSS